MNNAPPNGYEDWYIIRTHEIDARQRLTVPALMMLMQEASMHNARQLQISLWDEEMNNLSWVILRKELIVLKMPTLGQKVKVVTYPAGFQRVFAYRDFWVYDDKGHVLATASSTWTLMNLAERRISKIPQDILSLDIPAKDKLLAQPESKIVMSDKLTESYRYTIRHFDLDWNNHVNNIILAKLMIQSLGAGRLSSGYIKKFTIHIKAECYINDSLSIQVSTEDDRCFHQISGKDNKTIAMSISEWS